MEIPAHSYGHGRPTLIACALVATWWTGPCQRRLFSSVRVHEGNYKRWMNGVALSRSKIRLLGYVRSLWHNRNTRDLAQDSGEYLSALHNLHTLAFNRIDFEYINEEMFHPCFSAFRETLTHLTLDNFTTSFGAFVTFVDYFPNIKTLELNLFALRPGGGPNPSLSRPLRGKLHAYEVRDSCLEFFNRFATLDLEYEELVINSVGIFHKTKSAESILRLSPRTVKVLTLTDTLERKQPRPAPLIENASLPNPPTFKSTLR